MKASIDLRWKTAGVAWLLMAGSLFADWDLGDHNWKMHWPQLPDIYDADGKNGIDINATRPNILADDFRCTASGPITNIHVWGSWFFDEWDTNTVFTLSIHSDIPAGEIVPYSRPGPTLWSRTFSPGSYKWRIYFSRADNENFAEGWMDPPDMYILPGGGNPVDTICFQYNFPVPPPVAFVQTSNTIYWLDVQATTFQTNSITGFPKQFGWKTTPVGSHFNDDATWVEGEEPHPQGMWTNLVYPPGHPASGQTLDLAFVIEGGGGGEEPEPKWLRPLDTQNGMDVPSWEGPAGLPSIIVADDFISDGRPIVGMTWYGSYLGYTSGVSNPVSPPLAAFHPVGFNVSWYRDIPAGHKTNYSMPGELLKKEYYTLQSLSQPLAPVTETYYTNIWQSWAGKYEHEFVYTLMLTNGPWLEKEGNIYWLAIDAVYGEPIPPSNRWGWATTPPEYNWNDDAVSSNGVNSTMWDDLVYTNLAVNHPYGSTSVNLAFSLLTDVQNRRARKWAQPPDMTLGVNMVTYTNRYEPAEYPNLRADDFVSDGRRITDIHWWGSYPTFATNFAGPVEPPPPILQPEGFKLSWHMDIPTGAVPGYPYSMPGVLLANVFVPLTNCHEVYYGTVKQTWPPGTTNYEHEFQYYVDLLGIGSPWYETNGVVYWLDIQAVFPQGGKGSWGWKTTPPTNRWNDASVQNLPGFPYWEPAHYPPGHPLQPQPCDLAFELTTDQVGDGTNWWNPKIVIRNIHFPGASASKVGSVGDIGAGVQVLQAATNLVTSNWWDVVTNTLPLGFGQTNWWNDPAAVQTMKFYRVLQR